MKPYYGKVHIIKIEDGIDFWYLMNELQNDESGFWGNRNVLVERYKEGKMYGLRVEETDEMYKRGARQDSIFCKNLYGEPSWYLLPCFCIKIEDTAEIMWVHSRAQRQGFGRTMVQLLGIAKAFRPLEQSFPFWDTLGIMRTLCLPSSYSLEFP